ncbi:hypothetical protein COCHEDRAFT_1108162 [Bipolaris maydis C5]|uniref:Peptidase A1 domain-containing protein n=1 Tax=Cochliobolus heterostrophus (strain C5 / ATCC 48332 / race O) TaxID=701091 RepID=M2SVW6_COCH5|nr:hypothetical protein COCHEDRAFT_1108162 [Bipolaris maydis C5]
MSSLKAPRAATTAAPISFAPSQYFEGDDGRWSTFVVRVGTPEQSFRVLPSTVSSETFLPMAGACKDDEHMSTVGLVRQDCAFSRGAEIYQGRTNNGFQANLSSTWHEVGIYQTTNREELGYNASGLYGLDTLGLMIANSGGPTLENQTIGAVVNPRLWVGRLGMDVKPSNFSDFANPQPSLIKTLHEEGYIPSLSYGYTAGAYYKQPNVYGSLTYGGYDQSRFTPNNVTFPFDANDSRKPSLKIQAIIGQNLAGETISLQEEVVPYMLVDFAEPHIWLPVPTCDRFAKAFNLTYDNSTDLYLVDSSTHAKLVEQNPTITFGLGQTASDLSGRVNIVLPYSAFDQQASYPIFENSTNYFPIRRAYNETQYTLGRTFFQEAYIKIDYDRENFSIHQALFPTSGDKQEVIPVFSPTEISNIQGRNLLSKGAIAGIAIGSILLLAIASFLGLCVWQKRRKIKMPQQPAIEDPSIECEGQPRIETEGAAVFEKDGLPCAEMEGHIFPELYAPHPLPENNIPVIEITKADLSPIFELCESTDSRSLSGGESEAGISEERMRLPPG